MEKIIIFGTGKRATKIYNYMVEYNQKPTFFADNNAEKWGSRFNGIPILNPVDAYYEVKKGQTEICIASIYYIQVKKQLLAMGIPEEDIICESELKGKIIGKEIAFFGAGIHGANMLEFANRNHVPVGMFIDNNSGKWGQYYLGELIESPESVKKKENLRICITSIHEKEIRKQLLELGIASERIISEEEFRTEINGKEIVFFGAGYRGKDAYEIYKDYGIQPSFFVDNNEKKWGTFFCGIPVKAPKEIENKKNCDVYITSLYKDEITEQLLQLGISIEQIKYYRELIPLLLENTINTFKEIKEKKRDNKTQTVFFDCHYGLGLGGIERWTFNVAEELIKANIKVRIINGGSPDEQAPGILKDMVDTVSIKEQFKFKRQILFDIANIMVQYLPCTIISCHVDEILMAGYIVKLLYPEKVKLISTIHGGLEYVYLDNLSVEKAVDEYLGVSVDICENLIKKGIPQGKVFHMTCPVPCRKTLTKRFADEEGPIRIAYGGRLIKAQKRTELLKPLIKELYKKNIHFTLDIAGDGPLKNELEEFVEKNDFEDRVHLWGRLEKEEMEEFWKNRDIFINLSDYEGNSLSMMEAMANGLVPIVTRVSGVKENIKENYNGFVVEPENVSKMVEYIDYLDKHRELLKAFGQRCHDIIFDKGQLTKHIELIKKHLNYTPPQISVIVPIYNAEKYLDQCLHSILKQTFTDIEIICVNDGSTDRTTEMLRWFENYDNRVIVINKRNTGYGDSMNIGLKRAQGEYISIIESDDFAKPTMLEELFAEAVKKNVEVVKSNFIAYQRNWEVPEEFLEILKDCPYEQVCNPMINKEVFYVQASVWSALYKRTFLLKNDIWFNTTPGASFQDTSFAFKVWFYAERVSFVKEAYIFYRMNNENASSLSAEKIFCVCDEFEVIENLLNSDSLKKKELMPYFHCLKFRIYIWNYNRVAEKYQFSFLMKIFEEFKEVYERGKLVKEVWNEEDWKMLVEIMEDAEAFYNRTGKKFMNGVQ